MGKNKWLCAEQEVEYAPKVDSQQMLSFYMGKNKPFMPFLRAHMDLPK